MTRIANDNRGVQGKKEDSCPGHHRRQEVLYIETEVPLPKDTRMAYKR